ANFGAFAHEAADGGIGHAGSSGLDVSSELATEAGIRFHPNGQVIPAEEFFQRVYKCSAVLRVQDPRMDFSGIGIEDANFLGAGTEVADHQGDNLGSSVKGGIHAQVSAASAEAAGERAQEPIWTIDRQVVRASATGEYV